MKIYELLAEAVYDNLANALKRARPDKSAEIDAELVWAKNSLRRPDRINWYMLVVKNYFNNTVDQVQGNYNFTSLDQLHNDLVHYYGYNVPAIEAYAYKSQNIGELIGALDQLLKKHEEAERNRPKPVTPQTGDHVLFDFGGGVQWWWVDRGYCSDEGRSGRHCGNVVGQHKKNQRLLSLRKDGHVLLTFVLERNGALGEMKARGNQKPAEKYHPQIIRLLMWDRITGIEGMGYAPDANFSMFDLSEKNLAYMDANKPKLIADQCRVAPIEILRAPESIQKKYQQYITDPAIKSLIGNKSLDGWGSAVKNSPNLIIYAPHDMPGFENQLLNYLANSDDASILLKTPNSIARNPELLNKILQVNGILIAGVNPSVRGYQNLCRTAVQSNGNALQYVPEELRDREICLTAVKQYGSALQYVPEELRDRDMCLVAVKQNGYALTYVPEELRDRDMCLTAGKQYGGALQYVPKELRDRDMCLTAVQSDGSALGYVPRELRDPDICRAAVKSYGYALTYVPKELRDRDMCLVAVKQNGYALTYVPEEFQDRDMCLTAVQSDGEALQYVPEELRDHEMYLTAVANYSPALWGVPVELRDLEMCLAVLQDPDVETDIIDAVPEEIQDEFLQHAGWD